MRHNLRIKICAVILTIILWNTNKSIAQSIINLSGNWQFALASNRAEEANLSNFYQPTFNIQNFKTIPVPSNWAVLGFEEPVYRGFKGDTASEGFYRHQFNLPPGWKQKRVLLHFGGVWSSCEVWLNGVKAGEHHSGYTSFAFDVTQLIKAGETNELAVRVRQVNGDYQFDVYDDWTLGGIYRDVTLEAMPDKRWIDGVVVKTDFDQLYRNGTLQINTIISDKNKETLPGNYPSPGEPYRLQFSLLSKDNHVVVSNEVSVAAHTATDREIYSTFQVPDPEHWTAETPYLYKLRVDLIDGSEITHTRTIPVGFRKITTDGGVFRINGQAVKLRGVNRHDEHPDVGRATTRTQWLQDITLMKAANINYIRMSHYAPAKGFVELCDSLGMYVGEEVSVGGAGDLMYNPSFSGSVLQRTYETITRDINDPSVIYWSVGNEDPLTALHLAAVKFVKAMDKTRPVLLPWRADEWLPEEVDIMAPHYWKPQEYDRLAGRSTRPIISTEYTHAFGLDGFGGLETRWKALTKHPAGAGAAIWMWADQGIRTPVPLPEGKLSSISLGNKNLRIDEAGWDGIVDAYRNPTRDYWEAKAVYGQVYPAVEKIDFTLGQPFVDIPIQNDYDFNDLNAVTISWTIYEDDSVLASGSGRISGQPHALSIFKLPLQRIDHIGTAKTYYAQFVFKDVNDKEITREAVELEPSAKTLIVKIPDQKISVIKAQNTIVQAGDVRYIFNPRSGQLVSASLQDTQLITGLYPIIWHKPDRAEISVIGKKDITESPDLTAFQVASVTKWEIDEQRLDVVISASVNYTVDSNNQFTVDYQYTISNNGILSVHYKMATKLTVKALPVIGMTLQTPPEMNQLKWLGLGPYSAYPNKRSAPILGVWKFGLAEGSGPKSTRWIEQSNNRYTVRALSNGYLEYNSLSPGIVNILSGVLGRPEKGRKADESVPQLRTDMGEPFVGTFSIELAKRN